MANGIANQWRIDPLCSPLKKLLKLCVKYDYQGDTLNIDNRISLRVSEEGSALILCINNNPFLQLSLNGGAARAIISDLINGFTLGIVDLSAIQFATTDRTVTNRKFVKGVADAIERNLPSIEQMMKKAAGNRWR